MRHVALDRSHDGRPLPAGPLPGPQASAGQRHRGCAQRDHHQRAGRQPRCARAQRPAPRGRSAASTLIRAEQQPGQAGAGEGDQEGQERRSADGHPVRGGRRRLAHHQPSPREAPQGQRSRTASAATHQPATADRPGPQPQQQPLPGVEHREDHGFRDGQRGPDVPGHVDQPGQQREEERQAEDGARGERGPQPLPPQRQHEQRGTARPPAARCRLAGTPQRAPARLSARPAGPAGQAARALPLGAPARRPSARPRPGWSTAQCLSTARFPSTAHCVSRHSASAGTVPGGHSPRRGTVPGGHSPLQVGCRHSPSADRRWFSLV